MPDIIEITLEEVNKVVDAVRLQLHKPLTPIREFTISAVPKVREITKVNVIRSIGN